MTTEIPAEWGDFVQDNWERFATYAWLSYQECGRGAVVIDTTADRGPRFWVDDLMPTGRPMRGGYLTEESVVEHFPKDILQVFRESIEQYTPETDILFLLHNPYTGESQFVMMYLDPAPKDSQWTPNHE